MQAPLYSACPCLYKKSQTIELAKKNFKNSQKTRLLFITQSASSAWTNPAFLNDREYIFFKKQWSMQGKDCLPCKICRLIFKTLQGGINVIVFTGEQCFFHLSIKFVACYIMFRRRANRVFVKREFDAQILQ